MQLILFNPLIGHYQVLQFWARVDLEARAINGYSAFAKLQHHWNFIIRLFSVISRILIGGGGLLLLCRGAVGVFYSTSRRGN